MRQTGTLGLFKVVLLVMLAAHELMAQGYYGDPGEEGLAEGLM